LESDDHQLDARLQKTCARQPLVWKVHVLAALRGAQLVDFLNGTNEAPAAKLKIKVSKEDAGDDEVSNLAYDL
jgi:hypothetical protein